MGHIACVTDLHWTTALSATHVHAFANNMRSSARVSAAPPKQKKRPRGGVVDGGRLSSGAGVAIERDVFLGARVVLSLLDGRESEARALSGDLLGSTGDVIKGLRDVILAHGGNIIAQPVYASDVLVSVGDDGRGRGATATQREQNAIIEGKYDIVTLSWVLECVRRGVKLELGYFDYVHRSSKTQERLASGRNGYLRFGLPKRDIVDVAALARIYTEVGRQCDETELAVAAADVAAGWPDELAASRPPEWCVFEDCCAYFDWFAGGLTGPGPRVREPGTPSDLLRAGYAFVAAGGTRLDRLTTAATHVVVVAANEEHHTAAVTAHLRGIGSNAVVVGAEWVFGATGR